MARSAAHAMWVSRAVRTEDPWTRGRSVL
jgi:hypothetical protein